MTAHVYHRYPIATEPAPDSSFVSPQPLHQARESLEAGFSPGPRIHLLSQRPADRPFLIADPPNRLRRRTSLTKEDCIDA